MRSNRSQLARRLLSRSGKSGSRRKGDRREEVEYPIPMLPKLTEKVTTSPVLETKKSMEEEEFSNERSLELNEDEVIEFFERVEKLQSKTEKQKKEQTTKIPITPPTEKKRESKKEVKKQIEDTTKILIVGSADEISWEFTKDCFQKTNINELAEVSINSKWSRTFAWDNYMYERMYKVFGHENYKENQIEMVNAIKSNADMLVVMPEGSGKITAYKLCSICEDSLTIIIVSSIDIKFKQIEKLKDLKVEVKLLKSIQDAINFASTIHAVSTKTKFVYMTPDLIGKQFSEALYEINKTKKIYRFVIYNAEMISRMSDNFYKPYTYISLLRTVLPDIPVLAFTISSQKVQEDIQTQLNLKAPTIIEGDFFRKNIFYEIRSKENVLDSISKFIKSLRNTSIGLLICYTNAECERLSKIIKSKYNIRCEHYHDDMTVTDKKNLEVKWKQGIIRILIAVNINAARRVADSENGKCTLDFLIYYTMPKSMNTYIEDNDYLGRSNKIDLHSIIYYHINDKTVLEHLIVMNAESKFPLYAQENMYEILDYCEEEYFCRRKIQGSYSIPTINSRECVDSCDNCMKKKSIKITSFQTEAKKIFKFIKTMVSLNKNITLFDAVIYLYGGIIKEYKETEFEDYYGALKSLSPKTIQRIFIKLLINKVLGENLYKTDEGVITHLGMGINANLLETNEIDIRLTVDITGVEPHKDVPAKTTLRKYLKSTSKVRSGTLASQASVNPKMTSVDTGLEVPGSRVVLLEPPEPSGILKLLEPKSPKSPKAISDVSEKEDVSYLIQEENAENLLLRLAYVKNKLLLDLKDDEEAMTLRRMFYLQNMLDIARGVPPDEDQMRKLIEKVKWAKKENEVFEKYGMYFLQEIKHYLNVSKEQHKSGKIFKKSHNIGTSALS